ncbi:MAG: peptide deformylase [Chitinophagales bacterium]
MATLPIVQEGDGILRQRAMPVEKVTKRIQKLITDMFETMHQAEGVGLAAPQVGEGLRIIVVDVDEGAFALVNPVIVAARGEETELEGCLSLPGRVGYVTRAAEVVVRGLNRQGKQTEVAGGGLLARALQHEIDHLDGVLFTDRATGIGNQKGQGTEG